MIVKSMFLTLLVNKSEIFIDYLTHETYLHVICILNTKNLI